MSRFAINNPYFIVVCLIIAVVGGTGVLRMPIGRFPAINIPVVVVATMVPPAYDVAFWNAGSLSAWRGI